MTVIEGLCVITDIRRTFFLSFTKPHSLSGDLLPFYHLIRLPRISFGSCEIYFTLRLPGKLSMKNY